ncbi:MAG TPA: hypothetical protein VL595_18475 [Pseudonocardia sp.]|jgi:hypothetical protein|nr:hypothetical protein [Pseudonocardia sp.]
MSKSAALIAALLVTLSVPACSGSAGKADAPGGREFGLTDEQFNDHVERTQAAIAACMKRAGFDYVPVDVATIEKAQGAMRREPGMSDKEYHEKWGYSVSTRFDDPAFDIGLGPNDATMKSLPPAAQEAYKRTLLGANQDGTSFVEAFDDEDFDPTGGCTREGVSQVFTPEQLTGAYTNPKDVLRDQDPRMREARDKWNNCMQDQGYPYKDDQDNIIEDFKKRLDAITEGEDPASLTGERLDQLHQLQRDEIKVSLVDFGCETKYVNDVEQKVETEIFGHPVNQ